MTGDMGSQVELFDAIFELSHRVTGRTGIEELRAAAEAIVREHTSANQVHIVLTAGEAGTTAPEIDGGALARPDARLVQEAVDADEVRIESGAATRVAVPLRRGAHTLGALLAYVPAYTGADERTIRSIAGQISLLLENALLLEERDAGTGDTNDPIAPEAGTVIYGEPAGNGSAVGLALPWEASFEIGAGDDGAIAPDEWRGAFDDAVERSALQIERIRQSAAEMVDRTAATIFDAHLLMVRDETFTGRIAELIDEGVEPARAVRRVVLTTARRLERMRDGRFAEKAQDVRDVGLRLLRNLHQDTAEEVDYSGRIVVARHMYPSELVSLASQRIDGAIFLGVGLTAHLAILARSLELPSVLVQDRRILALREGTRLLVDGDAGRAIVEPGSEPLESDTGDPLRTLFVGEGSARVRDLLAQPTGDGSSARTAIRANVNLFHDATRAHRLGADGIGLYRSEFPFIIRSDIVGEEEQYRIYRSIVEAMPAKPVVMRTADIGGDKILPLGGEREANPFLGVRGIRFSLAHRRLFRDQLTAMLRAGAGADLKIMFPMVSTVEEVIEARDEVERCSNALAADDTPHIARPRLGAMVELPSAVEALPELIAELDFLSIGTNDLVMYLLAVDRTNAHLSELYRSFHPTVLRTLERIARQCSGSPVELSVCGDSAADPVMLAFLVGLGVRVVSVSPDNLLRAKSTVRVLDETFVGAVRDELLSLNRINAMERAVSSIRATITDRVRERLGSSDAN